jgi:hypothetical protein
VAKVCTYEKLLSVPVEQLSEIVCRSYYEVWSANPALDEKRLLAGMPAAMKFFAAMFYLEMEVANGGFCQYFWNSSLRQKDVTQEAMQGYYLIGVPEAALVVNDALSVANRELPNSTEKDSKKAFLELRSDPSRRDWDSLDTRMYQLKDQIRTRMGIFIRAHLDQFVF